MKLFWEILKINVRSIIARERPAFRKQAQWSWERHKCRDMGMD